MDATNNTGRDDLVRYHRKVQAGLSYIGSLVRENKNLTLNDKDLFADLLINVSERSQDLFDCACREVV